MRAIISAAGWKGAGIGTGLAGCPEPFLPLGDGTTTLSRTATILADNGYDVSIAIGRRGYPFCHYVRWTNTPTPPIFDDGFPWDASPWTTVRHNYAAKLGDVLEMPDPGGWTTSLDTLCESMDMLDEGEWDGLILTCGDMLIPHKCMNFILSLKKPFVFSFTAFHVVFGLDADGARIFRECAEPFRRFDSARSWKYDKRDGPSCYGLEVLKAEGFKAYGLDSAPQCNRWTDIDIDETYKDARALVAMPRFDGIENE
jgi:hypothetical protein